MFPYIFMSIYLLFAYFTSKYFFKQSKIIGIWIGIILFVFGILIIKMFLFTYGII
jgi:hypothetical protein